jgi:hypothetical protein
MFTHLKPAEQTVIFSMIFGLFQQNSGIEHRYLKLVELPASVLPDFGNP